MNKKQDPLDWPGAISRLAPIITPMTKIHLQSLKMPLTLQGSLQVMTLKFFFFLPWTVKYNPEYKYARDILWLNSPIGKMRSFQLQIKVQAVLLFIQGFVVFFLLLLFWFCLRTNSDRGEQWSRSNLTLVETFQFSPWSQQNKLHRSVSRWCRHG